MTLTTLSAEPRTLACWPATCALFLAMAVGCSTSPGRMDSAVSLDTGIEDLPDAADDTDTPDTAFEDLSETGDVGEDSGVSRDASRMDASRMDCSADPFDVSVPLDDAVDALVSDVAEDSSFPDVPRVLPPRLLAPLSGGRVSNRRPSLRWVAPPGVTRFRVDLCPTRDCTSPLATLMTTDTHIQPATALPPGVVFWRVTGLDGAGTTVWTSATWELVAPRRDAPIDTAWGVSHDYNGDGYADIAVADPGYMRIGRVYVYPGHLGGVAMDYAWSFTGTSMMNLDLGEGIAGVGDLNGDGFADLLVSDPGFSLSGYSGRAYLFLGSSTPFRDERPAMFSPVSGTASEFSEFGRAVSEAGDLNGDGLGDFVISSGENHGRIYVYLGNLSGVDVLTHLDGSSLFPGLGWSTAGAGDLDGDGYGDLVVSANVADGEVGFALVYYGSPSGPNTSPEIRIDPPSGAWAYGYFGWIVVGVGDLNGDHFDDLAIGSLGGVAVYYGRSDRRLDFGTLLSSPDPDGTLSEQAFGTQLGTPGDLNGDGYADLIVGGPDDGVFVGGELGGGGSGRTYVFQGGPAGVSASAFRELQGVPNGVFFGVSLTCPGDVDGDGLDDLVVGAIGYVYLFRGRRCGPSLLPDFQLVDPDQGPSVNNFGGFLN